MRIGLDVRYISHGLTGGVRTYVYHLATELPRYAPDHEFFYYADRKAPFELANLPENVTLRVLPWNGPLSSFRNDIQLGRWMQRDNVDLVHCPGNYGPSVRVPLVLTLHDTLNLFPMSAHLRGFGRRPKQVALMLYLGHMTRTSVKRAAHLITVSEHARRDIAVRTRFPLDRITVTHEAAASDFRRIDDRASLDDVRQRFGLSERFILADGIKNPSALIDAYGRMPEDLRLSTQLVFFSRETTPRPAVAGAVDHAVAKFISRPTTPELVDLMNAATIFAFPSWFEGFGLPLVEAMQCGTPTVASSRGSIPEIVGDAGLIFNLEEPAGFTRHLEQLLNNESFRLELSERAHRRSKLFTWRETAHRTMAVYEHTLLAHRRTA